MSTKFSINSEV